MNIFCFIVFNKYFAGKLILTKENNKLEVFHDNIFFISIPRFTGQIKMTHSNFEVTLPNLNSISNKFQPYHRDTVTQCNTKFFQK